MISYLKSLPLLRLKESSPLSELVICLMNASRICKVLGDKTVGPAHVFVHVPNDKGRTLVELLKNKTRLLGSPVSCG